MALCFHARKRCGFCGIPAPRPPRPPRLRLRCQCCGRFVKKPGKVAPIVRDRCPRCTVLGYEALRLAI